MSPEDQRPVKRPKRTYRACYPCRSRKLKCSFGDPNMPWDGPCERCLRESRECERAKPTFVRAAIPRKSDVSPPELPSRELSTLSHQATARQPSSRWDNTETLPMTEEDVEQLSSDDDEVYNAGDPLVTSNLQNPSDALRLLANASSLAYHPFESAYPAKEPQAGPVGNNVSIWSSWGPIQQGLLTVQDARALFSFFELEMAALFPLIHPMLFEPHYLATLVADESLLMGSILTIAARYSNILANYRGSLLHAKLSQWVRLQLMRVMDGQQALRSISTVEALLLLSEWPMLPMQHPLEHSTNPESEELLLMPSLQYDAYSWSNIGWAVRLAQELGIHEIVKDSAKHSLVSTWKVERMMKTWVYCCNADRHIAVRLGRNAVLQETMTSRWWEELSDHLNASGAGRRDSNDVWTSDVFMLACIAQLLGTIQEHLYSHKDVTRVLLRTGTWEAFLRRLRHEIRTIGNWGSDPVSGDGTVDSALLRMEFDYVVLYAYSLTLRALQAKLRRRRQANDLHYRSPSLLNMVEGPWIMEALNAARSIIEITLILEKRNILRYVPSRCFQYCLFATTFMYKALATGMVEHGKQSTSALLESVVHALHRASIDDQHFLRGFAGLLVRLGKHWSSAGGPPDDSPSVLNPGAEAPSPPLTPSVEPLLAVAQGTMQPDAVNTAGMPASNADLSWNFDPTFHMPAADHEQDLLFQSIWNTGGQDASGSASNLYATLLGDVLSFPEGLEGV